MDRKKSERNNFNKQDNRNSRVPNEEEHGRRRNDYSRQSQDSNFSLGEKKRPYHDSHRKFDSRADDSRGQDIKYSKIKTVLF